MGFLKPIVTVRISVFNTFQHLFHSSFSIFTATFINIKPDFSTTGQFQHFKQTKKLKYHYISCKIPETLVGFFASKHLKSVTFLDMFDKFVPSIIPITAKSTTELRFFATFGAHVPLQIALCVVRFQTLGTTKRVRLFSGRGLFQSHLLFQVCCVLIGLVRVNHLNGPTNHVVIQVGEQHIDWFVYKFLEGGSV